MYQEIINILYNVGRIPPEITLGLIIPYSDLLPCGCPKKNINRECPYYKIPKNSRKKIVTERNNTITGHYQICVRCKEDQVYERSHYCIFCKCNVHNTYSFAGEVFPGCKNPCVSNLKHCQIHINRTKHNTKGLYRRARKGIRLGICTDLECMAIAKEFKLINLQNSLKQYYTNIRYINTGRARCRPHNYIMCYENVLCELKLKIKRLE